MNASAIDRIHAAAKTGGWTVDWVSAAAPVTNAVRLTHPDYPRVRIEVLELAVRPHFRARVLIDRRERHLLGSAGDVVAVLDDPSLLDTEATR